VANGSLSAPSGDKLEQQVRERFGYDGGLRTEAKLNTLRSGEYVVNGQLCNPVGRLTVEKNQKTRDAIHDGCCVRLQQVASDRPSVIVIEQMAVLSGWFGWDVD
jgi:hypothetical protein